MTEEIMQPEPPECKNESAVRDVWRLIVDGINDADLLDHIKATYPKDEAREIIQAALYSMRRTGNGNLVKGWCFEAYKDLYHRSRIAEDYATARSCVDKISALFKGDQD
jgi:hypothetical protein